MKILKTIKYKGNFYKAGSVIEVAAEDQEEFIRKGIISKVEEIENTDNERINPLTESELMSKKNSDILNMLTELGIEVPSGAKKAEMVEIARENGLLGD